ncbi:unnamed protein product [Agarophyton chilense]
MQHLHPNEMSSALRDKVQVAVRIRPLLKRELCTSTVAQSTNWSFSPTSIAQCIDNKPVPFHSFSFDHIFLPNATNEFVFETVARPVVASAVDGINGVIFAYGQTAAGKTHTMLGNQADPGVTLRSISDVFERISKLPSRKFLLRASYLEIYNEFIRDLLVPSNDNLKIREDVVNNTVHVNSHRKIVTSIDDVMKIVLAGEAIRSIGATNMNEKASRSHTIITITIESRDIDQLNTSSIQSSGVAIRISTLSLVDLAGSERASLTRAQGKRLTEGGYINKSLLTLGNVIKKLSSCDSPAHVPYRDSKLTRLLQPALGGNARTAIICAVTTAAIHTEETLSTLKFASRAKKVTNSAETNEFLDDRAKLKRAEAQIKSLKKEMKRLRSSLDTISAQSSRAEAEGWRSWEVDLKTSVSELLCFAQKSSDVCSMCLVPRCPDDINKREETIRRLLVLIERYPEKVERDYIDEHSGKVENLSRAVKQVQNDVVGKDVELGDLEREMEFHHRNSPYPIPPYAESDVEQSVSACTFEGIMAEDCSSSSSAASVIQSRKVEWIKDLRENAEEKQLKMETLFRNLDSLKTEQGLDDNKSGFHHGKKIPTHLRHEQGFLGEYWSPLVRYGSIPVFRGYTTQAMSLVAHAPVSFQQVTYEVRDDVKVY